METKQISKKYTKAKKSISKIIISAALIISIFVIGFLTGFFAPNEIFSKPSVKKNEKLNVIVLQRTLESASDLITQRYVYSDAMFDEDSKQLLVDLPFTKKRVVFTYKGVISAGYDLSKIKTEINEDKKQIYLTLPKLKIVANEIDEDSYHYIIQEDSVFNPYKPEDMTKMQKKLKKRMVKVASEDKDFTQAARINAENILKRFLESSGKTEEYEIIVK